MKVGMVRECPSEALCVAALRYVRSLLWAF